MDHADQSPRQCCIGSVGLARMRNGEGDNAMPRSLRHTKVEVALLAGALALAMGSALSTREGDTTALRMTGFFLALAALQAFAPWLRSRKGTKMQTLSVDMWGVRSRIGQDEEHAVGWNELREVSILTTGDGPLTEDVFFLLRGNNEDGVVVGQTLALQHHLLETLQDHLPDLDNAEIIRAMGSTEEEQFMVWPPQKKA
jgi:hypothetical protein